jgi:nucleotide-binding universal stress UspA family protein
MLAQPIVVPVDFSRGYEPVIDLATNLAKEKNTDLIILHVEEPSTVYAAGEWYYGPLNPDPSTLRSLLQEIKPRDHSVRCHHRMAMGDPATQIVHLAETEHAQLIVMGTHGRSGVRRALYGSVTEEVVRKSTCPVLALKMPENRSKQDQTNSAGKYENIILVPTDFSESSRSALRWATDLARNQKSQLLLVHVQTPPYLSAEIPISKPSLESLESMLKEFDPQDPTIECRHLAIEGDPATEIVQLAMRRNVRCIVLGTHGRTGLSRLLLGSVAEQVIRSAACPVIVFKETTTSSNSKSALETNTAGLVV